MKATATTQATNKTADASAATTLQEAEKNKVSGWDVYSGPVPITGFRFDNIDVNNKIQPKLSINQPGDRYEQEADAMADKIMRKEKSGHISKGTGIPHVQRTCAQCEEEENQVLRKEYGTTPATPDKDFNSYIGGLNNGGVVMPESVRSFYEPHFNYDFSQVRIHTDSAAENSAQSINALAYTSGNHIVFNRGQYNPGSDSGKRLLGHELTHVVQQSARPGMPVQRQTRLTAEQLDNEYRTAFEMGDWQAAAEWLNGFSRADILRRLSELSEEEIADIHQGALDNPRLGAGSQVATLTQRGTPAEAAPTTAATVENIAALSASEKLSRAWAHARGQLSAEAVHQIQGFFAPESLAALAVFAALYIAAQFTPVGWVADALALTTLTLSVLFVGMLVIDIARNLYRFFSAVNATRREEIEASGNALARAIIEGGIGIVIALISRALPRGGGTRPPPSGTSMAMGEFAASGGVRIPVRITTIQEVPAALPRPLVAYGSYAVMVPPPTATRPGERSTESSSGSGGSGRGGRGPGRRGRRVDYPPAVRDLIEALERRFPALRNAFLEPRRRGTGPGMFDERMRTGGGEHSFDAELRDGRIVQIDDINPNGIVHEIKMRSVEIPEAELAQELDFSRSPRSSMAGEFLRGLEDQMARQSEFINENGLPHGVWETNDPAFFEVLVEIRSRLGIRNITLDLID